ASPLLSPRSLHDALPIFPDHVRRFPTVPYARPRRQAGADPRDVRVEAVPPRGDRFQDPACPVRPAARCCLAGAVRPNGHLTTVRSAEPTSELQSRETL